MSASDPEARDVSDQSPPTSTSSNPSLSVNLEPFLTQLHHGIHGNASNNAGSGSATNGNAAAVGTGAVGDAPNPAQHANQPAIDLVKMVLPSLPFLLLLALKFLFDHKVGLLLFICLALLFAKCNEGVVSLVTKSRAAAPSLSASGSGSVASSLPGRRLIASYRYQAACLCLVCLSFVLLVLYVFRAQSLWLCLLCLPPTLPAYGFWSLLFTVTVTDMLLKFVDMSIKLAVLWLLSDSLGCVSLTRIYIIIERFYQFYRQFAPIGVWYVTLVSNAGPESSRIYTSLLVFAYGIFKVHSLYTSALPQAKILSNLIRTPILFGQSLGLSNSSGPGGYSASSPSNDSGECPICQEAVRDPVRLACQHAFCLGCLLRWLAQSRTCPMCRQAVMPPEGGQDALAWLDGSTASGLQIY